jgi:dihydroflavonol-4-reductase
VFNELNTEQSFDIAEIVKVAKAAFPQRSLKVPPRPPRAALYLAALMIETIAKLRGRKPTLQRGYLRDFTVDEVCDCSKARSELDFDPRPAPLALERAFRWLVEGEAAERLRPMQQGQARWPEGTSISRSVQ